MAVATLDGETDFDGWRKAARAFRLAGVEPAAARFVVAGTMEQGGLFDQPIAEEASPTPDERRAFNVPKEFVDLAQNLILHRSADRFDLMYRLLWRLKDEPDLIKVISDRDVADALERVKNVSRASHKMKAFVRFRQVHDDLGEAWVAWFEPPHRVLEKTAPFFQRRFTTMRWSILTPDGSAVWDGEALRFGRPATRDLAPAEDEIEDFWKTYYASTFNPARLKVKTMQGEMAKSYWKNLPEAALIPELVVASSVRTETMVATPSPQPNSRFARAVAPDVHLARPDAEAVPQNLDDVASGVQACRRCPLYRDATQGVCGEGPKSARLMIVGEQPGDQEDLAGRAFIGPAGQVLNAALAEAGIDRSDVYVTNAVKHFKHEPRGKRRLHKTPNAGEVQACRWWLDSERRLIKPQVVLALGATASLALLGRKPAVMQERGAPIDLSDGSTAVLTVHPSYLLRLPDEAAKSEARRLFIEDLTAVQRRMR
ncbi:UdgX family uracil-DNA binding protein [Brevundimonas vesicularis]|uniref:Type-4 uracil-DNA glycosylase n=1 Tax=Brevundimonas vesicularis TaxID=41276 RepID=A0A1Z3UBA1_BREVE|nr:UdgX family uracil-DNA binding protein [Brevundimonas vesicularis]ASE40515.1 uracil-DNA glycosylase [Brevundimonas vesicularis]MDX2334665.1 UdgX family uracil-DNA binding protein [Brevundimonas vesicularis]